LKANDWTATREVVEAVRNEFRIGRSTVLPNDRAIPRVAKGIKSDPSRPRHSRRR